jgi:small subunit ribosomal protein S1
VSVDPLPISDADLSRQVDQELGDVSSEDLARMAEMPAHEPRLDARGKLRGRVLGIRGSDVFVDIGGKSEGFVALDEFEPDQPPVIDQVLDLVPQGFDKDSGLMRLSLREAKLAVDMESICVGDVVKARVTGSNIGGLELRVHGARGFMPMSQVDLIRHDDMAGFIGRWLECEVTEVDRKGRGLVLSRRRVLERQREEDARQLRFQLAEGQVRRGKVVRLLDFGAFVDLGGVEGLLHVSDMSWARIGHPKEVLNVGNEIDVKILKIDLVKDRISLGSKQLSPDPWTMVAGKYGIGQTIEGKVLKLMNFGAFVELEPGVEGLIPISEMSWSQHVRNPKDIVNVGDHVRVCVLSVDAENRKLSLSLKALASDPWSGVNERYALGTTVSGLVTRITNFGAFVQLEEGVEGLVHISQLSAQRIRAVSDAVEVGKVVQVRILSVDPEQRRVSLSMKPLPTSEPERSQTSGDSAAVAEPPKPEKKRKRPLRGGLSW